MELSRDELKKIFREVLKEEFDIQPVALGDRWHGGKMFLEPRNGTGVKEMPIENFFHKIVMIRDRIRVMEQKINSSKNLSDEEKVDLQQYITRIYGSLTTFNVLFADREDGFRGESTR